MTLSSSVAWLQFAHSHIQFCTPFGIHDVLRSLIIHSAADNSHKARSEGGSMCYPSLSCCSCSLTAVRMRRPITSPTHYSHMTVVTVCMLWCSSCSLQAVIEKFSMHRIKAAVVLLIGTLNVLFCHSAIPDDRLEVLPGWSGPLPSAQYSGYIKLNPSNGKQLYYW